MNKDEMIRDIVETMNNTLKLCDKKGCGECEFRGARYCGDMIIASALYNAGYRKVEGAIKLLGECETVRVMPEEALNETLNSVLESGKRMGYAQGRDETARKILQIVDDKLDLYRNGVIGGTLYDAGYKNAVNEIKIAIKNKFGIELE